MTADGQQALELLHKWDVDYVVVGPPERRYAEGLCSAAGRQCSAVAGLRKFDLVLELAFKQGETAVYRVPERQ